MLVRQIIMLSRTLKLERKLIMNKLVRKFGKYKVVTFIIMALGLLLFFLTPLLLWLFNFDSDILGLLILIFGLVMWVAGIIVRKIRGHKQSI